jgi:Rrf2 family protein
MLKISKQSDYGLILTSYIYKKNKLVRLSELIKETKLPKRFLARIAAQLVKQGILTSREGKLGGYQITKKINEMSFYEYLKIFENYVQVSKCVDEDYHCKFEAICDHKDFLSKQVNQALVSELKKIKLLKLLH